MKETNFPAEFTLIILTLTIAGGECDAGPDSEDAGLRARQEDEPQGSSAAPLLRSAVSLPEARGRLQAHPQTSDLENFVIQIVSEMT